MSDTLQPELNRLAGVKGAEDAIHRAFFAEARAAAAAHLSRTVQRTVGPTAVANAAIHSAIRAARRADTPLDEDHFRRMVFLFTQRKAADAARRATAAGRDVRKTTPLTADGVSEPADDEARATELARELAGEIVAWILTEPDDTRRLIRYFGLIELESATAIHARLVGLAESQPDLGFRVPAVRTIQLDLQETRQAAVARFGT